MTDPGRETAPGRPWPMPESIETAGKSLWQLIDERASLTPDKRMAIDEQDRSWTYDEFRAWCERAAAGLAARGVGEGTNVSWILPSRIEAFVLAGALARLGAVQNPILPIYRHREIGFITRQTGCELLIVPGTFRNVDYEKIAREATEDLNLEVMVADPDLPEGDPAALGAPASGDGDPLRWLFYTSGTVADPKGAKHSDASIAAAIKNSRLLTWSPRKRLTGRRISRQEQAMSELGQERKS